jgi:hypothetical protein
MESDQNPDFNANQDTLSQIEGSAPVHQPPSPFEVKITKDNVLPDCELTLVCRLCDDVYSDPTACKHCEEVACRPCMMKGF